MIARTLRGIAVALSLAGVAALSQGCAAEVVGPPVYAEGYQPAYYDGYVVYYDGGGRPFYYLNGAPVFVPERSPYYAGLVNHWHAYGPAYHAWYGRYGYRYHGYRRF